METSIRLVKRYFDFDYVLGCAIALIIFVIYFRLKREEYKSQGQSISKKDIFCGLALVIYITAILGGTLLNRSPNAERTMEWMLFWSYRDAIVMRNSALAWQILYNVIVFIPWGILLPETFLKMRSIRWVVGSVMLFSFLIEVIQLIFKLGLFEFDDVFHNTLGATIGYGIWRVLVLWKNKTRKHVC